MRKFPCKACGGIMDLSMAQQGDCHVGCYDNYSKQEIDVYYIQDHPGESGYYEKSLDTILDMLRDSDVCSEYIIYKKHMTQQKYDNLPEFSRF